MILKKIVLLILTIFVIASLLLIDLPIKTQEDMHHSSSLSIATELIDGRERAAFLDRDDVISFAADVGYAIKTTAITHIGKLEEYYDEFERPIMLPAGYHAILYENNDSERIEQITYLGLDSMPIVISYGYAIIEKKHESDCSIKELFYDDTRMPVCTKSFGYGRKIEYDTDGKIIRTTFLDNLGNPMNTDLGYAIIEYKYNSLATLENGKSRDEYYFDNERRPINLYLGQYGLHREFNEIGQNTILTYLDQYGQPIVTTKGYTTVVRAYSNDNTVTREQYFDIHGNPYCLSEGQYGIMKDNGRVVYLNQDGSEQFNLRRFLYNHSYFAVIFALFLVLISTLTKRWPLFSYSILVLYIGVIVYFTLLYRNNEFLIVNLKPFQMIKRLLSDAPSRSGIIRNIWLFIPLGSILAVVSEDKRILIVPIVISIIIESIQYFAHIGYCEADDVICNSIGSGIGYIGVKLSYEWFNVYKKKHL